LIGALSGAALAPSGGGIGQLAVQVGRRAWGGMREGQETPEEKYRGEEWSRVFQNN